VLRKLSEQDRAELAEASRRPLEPEKWAGGVDTVGAAPLATVLKRGRVVIETGR
jgi:hypothetical protein